MTKSRSRDRHLSSPKRKSIKRLVLELILLLAGLTLCAAGVAFTYWDKVAGATATYAAGLILITFSFLDRLKSLSGAGIKLEMIDAKIAEAEDTLERLRGLATSMAAPIQFTIAHLGTWGGSMSRRDRHNYTEALERELRLIGVPEECVRSGRTALERRNAIEMATPIINQYMEVLSRYQQEIDFSAQEERKNIENINSDLEAHKAKRPRFQQSSTAAFISDSVIAYVNTPFLIPAERLRSFLDSQAEVLKDLEHYGRTGEIRRLDVWLQDN